MVNPIVGYTIEVNKETTQMANVHHYYHGKPTEFEYWCWYQMFRMFMIGALISVPMAAYGVLTTPVGTTRSAAALAATVDGHAFLWKHAIAVVTPVVDGINQYANSPVDE